MSYESVSAETVICAWKTRHVAQLRIGFYQTGYECLGYLTRDVHVRGLPKKWGSIYLNFLGKNGEDKFVMGLDDGRSGRKLDVFEFEKEPNQYVFSVKGCRRWWNELQEHGWRGFDLRVRA